MPLPKKPIPTPGKVAADTMRAKARMKALLEASKKAGKPKPKKPVMTEGTGNPSDPKDWTNAPGNKAFADQLKKINGGR